MRAAKSSSGKSHYLIQLHLLVFIFASTAILGRLCSLSAASLVVWRSFIAAAIILPIASLAVRNHSSKRSASLLIGFIVGLHWLCFFASVQVSNVSICLAGLSTVSLFTSITEPIIEKRRIRWFEVTLGVFVLLGVLLIAGAERTHWLGLGLGLLSALLAAVFPPLNRQLVTRGGSPLHIVGWQMIGSGLICLLIQPVLDPSGFHGLLEWNNWDALWVLALALIATAFSHTYLVHLLKHLSAYTSSLAINFEPVYGILAASILFHEHHDLHFGFYLGVLIILAANILHPWLQRRFT